MKLFANFESVKTLISSNGQFARSSNETRKFRERKTLIMEPVISRVTTLEML